MDQIPLSLADDLQPLLRTRRLGRPAAWHEALDSTNLRAAAWAEAGAPEGALVGAEHQSAGRGRLGRRWESEPGESLLVSVVLCPALAPERLGLIPIAAGVAVAEALAEMLPALRPVLKWPNDVLLNGKKVCGVLAEGSLGGARPHVVLGLGLNVNQTAFPDDLATPPTSLRLEAGRPVERAPLLAAILLRLEERYEQLGIEPEVVREAFEARMAGLGGRAVLTRSGERIEGEVLGLAEDGGLRLGTAEGERTFHAGEVTLRRGA